VELGSKGQWCHLEETPEIFQTLGATTAVGILLKEPYEGMPLVLVVLLGLELLSVLITLL
jgi:hypothetical protein